MENERTRALSDILDQLEKSAHSDSIPVQEVVEQLGRKSFASLMLVFALISTSPASAIPGITATVAAIVFILVVQMLIGRKSVWLPGLITRRHMSTVKLCKAVGWLRKPVEFVEGLSKPHLTFLFHRPWVYLPLLMILSLTLFMPFYGGRAYIGLASFRRNRILRRRASFA